MDLNLNLDRLLTLLMISGAVLCALIFTWAWIDISKSYFELTGRMTNVEQRQDRLAQAYLRVDAEIDKYSERLAQSEGRLIAINPEDVLEIRRDLDQLKKDIEKR